MQSLSTLWSEEISAENTASIREENIVNRRPAGRPARRALECRLRLSVTQRGEPYFLAPADDQIDAEMKRNTTEEYFQTRNKKEKQNTMCLIFYFPGFQIAPNIYSSR